MDEFDQALQIVENYKKRFDDYFLKKPEAKGIEREKILVMSDLHFPFARMDLVNEILKEHADADKVVLTGDLFENHLISTFSKERHIPLQIEYAAVFAFVKKLSKMFPQVVLIDGNHDYGRFHRELNKMDPTVFFLMKGSPLQYVAEGYEYDQFGNDLGVCKMDNVVHAVSEGHNWWVKIGKTIFAHRLKGFNKGPMASAVKMADWFINQGISFQALVCGHSHRVGVIPYKGKLIIDEGALCYPLEYETNGSCNVTPVDLGYALIYQDRHGNVDIEQSGVRWLGTYRGDDEGL